MVKGEGDEKDFVANAVNTAENTVNFENCSSFTKYDYEDKNKSVGTALNLCYSENYILNTIIPYLKENSEIRLYDKEEAEQYYGQPMKFSYDEYSSTEFWWIILAINGYFNPREFTGWTQLVVPTLTTLEQIIDRELYVNEDIGNIPPEDA